ncbi:MBOAT family O-acyltransferase [Sphingomonas sp. HF-S3]|uniref:Probable alginate O-acetylase AlgI n=1 Tax=Sphingomonas rustica TaxID=3103142 RepID=A0ABV0B947_9SPHN
MGFLFVLLPASLALYHLLVARSDRLRQPFLVAVTLIFYAIGGSQYLLLLIASVALNYMAARLIASGTPESRQAKMALATGISLNLALLFYFKYMNFFIGNANALFGTELVLRSVVLPLGISFFTFQQIGFLVDLSRGRFALGRAIDYASFVLFFPQLLSGPIVKYDELTPQLRTRPPRGTASANILIGLTIFALGLAKKTVIADSIGGLAAPVFDAAAVGRSPGMAESWIAAFAYTAQIYFDFSGYSDMAIGVARMFGIVLPLNFHSPLRATSIIDLWRRWHVTLSRWAQTYIFQPLSMPMARFAAHRMPGRFGMFLMSFALPTMLSMIVIGIWHGAGWTFVLFGALQGLYMAVNEYWRQARRKKRKANKSAPRFYEAPLARALTLVAFVVAVVAFRAPDLASASILYASMIGGGDAGAPLLSASWPGGLGGAVAALAAVYAIVYLAPNTQQFMARWNPVLEWEKWRKVDPPARPIEWKMTAIWVSASALVLFLGFVLMMRGTTNFIYFNF